VNENDFNYTLNPSAIKAGTSGSYIDAVTGSEFRPYVTTVGVYNDADELLVVGKLSTPYPVPPNTDTLVPVAVPFGITPTEVFPFVVLV